MLLCHVHPTWRLRDMNARTTELEEFLETNPDVSHIDALVVDLCGNAIGKRVPAGQAGSLFSTGTSTCAADHAALLGHAVAGLQATPAESMAIFAPNINDYRRFKPDQFVPVTRDRGENNRSVAFRLSIGADYPKIYAEVEQTGFDAFMQEAFSLEFDWYL
jgi:glutamine synthetase